MTDGLAAEIHVAELPDQTFQGRVARNSSALLSSSRTLTVEIDIENGAHRLRPGQFVQATLAIPRAHPAVEVPAEALVFDQKGMQVAIVGPDNHVRLQRVTVGRDSGASIEIDSGLDGGETVVLDLPAGTSDGAAVKVAAGKAEHTAEK